ncbi:uncharacterized protein SPPG_07953 [Spizellomyces punctatus DAOM BR117]|uniref:K Homology domain-containing protein n=1 Tax=Spizellomyces punctatus (strain DAOM BR117) TaxID=645134 RepID=A0A0L0H5G3_SPIPD|nr:uncharacterized protein SPPG_07953 [Spizellomyces punctatus DAOM BR117]KNC96745.1 hypothetical protein SPPG_07953 [Spizellomyces punctatus DAOM BR117]|eukprot:XP_016604785.1 hypothetical protein SPPG_07953 [Spizellomyces punctatus DAOM BR117]
MTYNAVKPPDALTGEASSSIAPASAAVDYTSALERAKAIAARLTAAAAKGGDTSSGDASGQGVKRSHSEVDDYRPPSSGYRKEDYRRDDFSSERDNKRHASDSDRYDRDDRDQYDYGSRDGGSGGRQRYGLGHSEGTTSHYGPSSSASLKTTEEIAVPNQYVGLVIGRAGENMKRIERTCNVKVQFAPAGSEPERRTTITGNPEDVQQAKSMILEQINQGSGPRGPPSSMPSYGGNSSTNTETMSIPAHKVGLVIGRGGETIHSLQDRSGARIAVMPDSQSDQPSNLRQINLSGSPEAIDMARALIDDLVNAPSRPGGPGGMSQPYGNQYGHGGSSETIKVHTEKVGLIIGRGGEVVKNIQATCNVRIQIEQQADPEGNRDVTISGPQENIDRAKEMVMDRVQGRRDSNPQYGYNQQGYNGYGNYGNYASGDNTNAWGAAQGGDATGGYAAGTAGYDQSGAAGYAGWDQSAYGQGYEGQQYDQEAWNAYYQQYYQQYPGYGTEGYTGAEASGADVAPPGSQGAGAPGVPGTGAPGADGADAGGANTRQESA